jgi:RHS repeat-associated protein
VAELSGRSAAYGYDSLYRLTSETVTSDPSSHNFVNGFTYDAVGNRKQWLVNGVLSNAYTYDPDDRLGSDQYDPNGNTTNSFGVANSYDFENHLIQKGAVTVVYDGDGNRVSETVAGVTTNYLVDTNNPTGYAQVVDELQNGTVSRTYAYGLERINENQVLNGTWTTSFYGYDGHGSVRQLTNPAGTVTDTYDYDAFGNLVDQTGTTPNNYLFAGEQYDPALGLYYNRARYLNTNTGRFWSVDTDEGNDRDPMSLNKYLYTDADPIDGTDPSGFQDSMAELGAEESLSATLDAMPTLSAATTINGSCDCEVHFDRLGTVLGYTFNHAYILLKPSTGTPTIFRAGPSVSAAPNDSRVRKDTIRDLLGLVPYSELLPEFGYLKPCMGPFTPDQGCGDYPSSSNDDVAMEKVTSPGQSCDTLKFNLQNQASVVSTLDIPYHNVRQNSNSYVHTILSKVASTAPEPPVSAPGRDNILY